MSTKDELIEGLEILGELLASRGQYFDIVVVGGGALILKDLINRSTQDIDIVAIVNQGQWTSLRTLPDALVKAIREVAEALDLPREPRDEKDWLNPGPSFLKKLGLPTGFDLRTETRVFGNLKVRFADRRDLITLKLWAATDAKRGSRRAVDIDDLIEISPTREELQEALSWCAQKDGRPDFVEIEADSVIRQLGFNLDELFDV